MAQGDVNEVRLLGRVSGVTEVRELPSGDVVHGFRLVAKRPKSARPGVDTIDVAAWTPATRRVVGRLSVEERVEVTGSIRRRFFLAGGAVASRYEVEATRIRRLPAQ